MGDQAPIKSYALGSEQVKLEVAKACIARHGNPKLIRSSSTALPFLIEEDTSDVA
jgi:hypothetical protein